MLHLAGIHAAQLALNRSHHHQTDHGIIARQLESKAGEQLKMGEQTGEQNAVFCLLSLGSWNPYLSTEARKSAFARYRFCSVKNVTRPLCGLAFTVASPAFE